MGSIEGVSEGVHDFDSPWKEALEDFLQPALELFQPHVAQAIDWSCPPVFLDKELQSIRGWDDTTTRRRDEESHFLIIS